MSELKAILATPHPKMKNACDGAIEVYPKSEADDVIAEKDKEIARLDDLAHAHNIELLRKENLIAELKKERDWLAKDRAQAYDDLEKRAQLNIKQEESIRHQKYKRCLALAEACMHKRWRTDEGFDYARSTRQMKKMLEIAENFKPNSTDQQVKG